MDEQCKSALDLLVQNGYLEIVKGKYRATKKLNENVVNESIVIHGLTDVIFSGDWEALYIQFIKDCRIPSKGESGDGSLYDLNKYSEEGMKQFKQMMKDGIKYYLLVRVTSAYYNGSNRYRKKIGNYITEGLWRLDYQILDGKSEQEQQQTLQKQADESKPFTRDRIG